MATPFLNDHTYAVPHPKDIARSGIPSTEPLPSRDDAPVGSNSASGAFHCDSCPKTFAKKSYLARHIKYNHRPIQLYKCLQCKFQTKFSNALSRHVKLHLPKSQLVQRRSTVFSCVLCKQYDCENRKAMIKHYCDNHGVAICEKRITFKSSEQFRTWKNDIEQADTCRFVTRCGPQIGKDVQVQYYRCFRDGSFHSNGKGKRHLKVKGSVKIGGICPASIKVETEKVTGMVRVTFISNHVGHGHELGRLNLTKHERAEIARQLAQNVPYEAIMNQIRSAKKRAIHRIHLTTRKDIWNIQASFKLGNVAKGFLHSNDRTSVEAWVKLMQQESDVVRFYKAQGKIAPEYPQLAEKDMVLIIASDGQLEMLRRHGSDCICFDGTHGLNPYEFELHTVMVLDDLRQGFPCAFLFSNRSDSDVMAVFVHILREALGTEIQPNVLMTDMSLIYVNGWRCFMPEPNNTLFCIWHVDRAWRTNLSKVKGVDKKKEVYHICRTLMEEVDETAFQKLLGKAIQTFLSDPATVAFGEYFQETYSSNVKKWAFCHRKYCGLTTNMHLENMHKILKYVYLNGKKIKRLDKTISALLRLVRDKFYDQLICTMRGKLTSKITTIRKRHKTSSGMSSTVLACAEGWVVSSQSGLDMYFVRKLNVHCNCDLKCEECRICIHEFSCECIDSVIKFNICKHIHYVASCLLTDEETGKNVDFDEPGELVVTTNDDYTSMEEIIVQELSTKEVVPVECINVESSKERFREKFEDILDNMKCDEHVHILWNALVPVIPTFEANSSNGGLHYVSSNGQTKKVNPLQNASPQKDFYSTKARRQKTRVLAKPTSEEKIATATTLLLTVPILSSE